MLMTVTTVDLLSVLCPGTVSYCAPELLKEGKLTKAADVYSFAMIMWEMYSGTALFRGMNSSQVGVCHISDQLAAATLLGQLGPAMFAYAVFKGSGQRSDFQISCCLSMKATELASSVLARFPSWFWFGTHTAWSRLPAVGIKT